MQKDKTIFQPDNYLKRFYQNIEGKDQRQFMGYQFQWTTQAFQLIPQCDTYLEIGCGPVLIYAGMASKKCKSLYLTQYNAQNFQPIIKDLTKDFSQKSFWEPHWQMYKHFLKDQPSEIKRRLREKVVCCLKCDLRQQNIVQAYYFKKVDVVLSSLCLQSVARNIQDYTKMVKNMKEYLKIGGYIYFFGVLQNTYYIVDGEKLTCFSFNQELIKETLEKNDLQIIKFNADRPQYVPTQFSDWKGLYSVLAQRKK